MSSRPVRGDVEGDDMNDEERPAWVKDAMDERAQLTRTWAEWEQIARDFQAECDDARAELVRVRQEADEAYSKGFEQCRRRAVAAEAMNEELLAENERLRGVLQQVSDLHVDDPQVGLHDETCCTQCGIGLPCPTLKILASVSGSANPKQEADEIPADLWRDNDEFGWTSFAKPNGPIHPQPRRGDASTYHRQVWRSGWHPLLSSSAGSVGETP